MKTDSVKININNIKDKVVKHYFKYRDIFYRMLIANICIYNYLSNNVLKNTIFEDTGYNQFFLYVANKQLDLEGILTELNIIQELPLYMELSLYIEEFIQHKHSNEHINVYSLTISDQGYLIVYNKKLSSCKDG